jgi:hypothetical protein
VGSRISSKGTIQTLFGTCWKRNHNDLYERLKENIYYGRSRIFARYFLYTAFLPNVPFIGIEDVETIQ